MEIPIEYATTWQPEILQQWDDFWTTDVAKAMSEASMPGLVRLFDYRSQWLRARIEWVNGGCQTMVPGSRSNTVLHPMLRQMRELEAVISTLEKQFGLTPYAAAKLGFKLGEAKLTWAQLRAKEQDERKELREASVASLPSGLPVIDIDAAPH